MNSPAALLGTTAQSAATAVSHLGFVITPDALTQLAADVGEKSIISRAGGAPTLAVGMAQILANVIGGKAMMAFWYHFAILFEALFILTAVDAGTRAGRFMLQDLLGVFAPSLKRTESLPANLIATGLCVAAWGYFLYQGVVDPLGGINTLWPLFGIANQMLAGIALSLGTAVLFKMKRGHYAWVTIVPTIWLLICTLTAGWQKIFDANVKVGFVAHAQKFQAAFDQGKVLAPAKSLDQMGRVVFNDYLDAALCGFFMLVVVAVAVYGVRTAMLANKQARPSAKETPYVPVEPAVEA
jgi:carbon starvation protein